MALLFLQLLIVEEADEVERRRESRRIRRALRDAQDPFSVPDAEFIQQFRLNKDCCHYLIEALEPHMDVGRYSSKIPNYVKILATLHFFAMGSYQRSVGSNILACLSQPIVSRSIREVSNLILRHLTRRWIRFPRNDDEKRRIRIRFQQRYHMPHVIGIVDGTHVAIVPPAQNEHVFVNRKGYHSLNCQIVCDADLNIINVVSQWPGSTHDAYVWRRSRIGQTMRANYEHGDHDSIIIGDSGYACLPWLMVPLINPTTHQEIRFNYRFRRCRSIVERCIGLLKGRFRCLLRDRTLHYTPQTSARIILCCAVLHNIALRFHVEEPVPMWDEIDLELPAAPEPEPDAVYRNQGQQRRRNYIANSF